MIHKILKKISNFYRFYNFKKNYVKETFENEQNQRFNRLGLNRQEAINKLIKIKEKNNFLDRRMSSEHEVLFAAISNSSKYSISKILEIGTYDGANSYLLSLLFNNSEIQTIDLDDKDSNFELTYNRKDNINKFITDRNKIISKGNNIKFKPINSIQLTNYKEKFDLIWIDGAHGYPVVCIDIINSLKLVNDEGIIICDDVYFKKPTNQDSMYRSIASYETLKSLENEKIISLNFLYKRLDLLDNCDPQKRKFLGFFKKI